MIIGRLGSDFAGRRGVLRRGTPPTSFQGSTRLKFLALYGSLSASGSARTSMQAPEASDYEVKWKPLSGMPWQPLGGETGQRLGLKLASQ